MSDCQPCRTPVDTGAKLSSSGDPVPDLSLYRSLTGALQYVTHTRPDISYSVHQACLFMHDPRILISLMLNEFFAISKAHLITVFKLTLLLQQA
jgi:hypothetical protein